MNGKYGRLLAASALGASAAFAATITPAHADYGPTAVYQIELSANASGPNGGGVWLWLELSSDGTVDYSGADCGHGHGATSDRGSTTWSVVNGRIVIPGVILNGLGWDATVRVPVTTGHYTGTVGTYITLPPFIPSFIGRSQLQVAP